MFTVDYRTRLRFSLLGRASCDARISGGAITGSAAADREDRWSDIDLAFGIQDDAELQDVLADWTGHMYREHGALHHLDVNANAWIYRVFLLPGTLQVDLAFVPAAEFKPLAPTFRLIFGSAKEGENAPSSSPAAMIGFGWLYAIHARTSIARRNVWQAEYMISGVRDHAFALACLRHGVPAVHGKGMDQLPAEVAGPFEGALVRGLDSAELSRAFGVALDCLIKEMRFVDEQLAGRLQAALVELAETTH
jgi:hypothetical protein